MKVKRSTALAIGDYRVERNNGQYGPGKWAVLSPAGTVVSTNATLKGAYASAVEWARKWRWST